MTPAPCLQFLRPYAWRPLGARKARAVYLRFYHLSRQQELVQAGALKYPRIQHQHGTPMRIPVFREKYKDIKEGAVAEEEVVLRGRIQSVRRASSKLVFLSFTGEFEQVQGLCNFRKLEASGASLDSFKELARLLQRGDIVSVTGRATRTPTGELTIEATRLPELLSPSLVPLPFRLLDDDTRIQQRHIDLLVNRAAADTLRLRSHIIKYMRDFFHERGFLEFQTPILAEKAGGAVARPFATRASEFPSRELAMRIAPELWLKRLVVGGVDRVFEIGPAFRNEGIDLTHNPEFTTCEFYSAYANLADLTSQTEELVAGVAEHCRDLVSSTLTSLPAVDVASYARPFRQMEFIPALEAALGFKLPDLAADSALDDLRALLLASANTDVASDHATTRSTTSLPKLLDRLAATHIEPHSLDAPLFITHHPACMSPLAKSFACPRTGQLVSARAELFVRGSELANMYEEENDPAAQRAKFADQARYRLNNLVAEREAVEEEKDDDGEIVVADESFVQALESGLPPTGGWGCGVERLVMLFAGTRRINDTLSFGTLRNVVGLSSSSSSSSSKAGEQDPKEDEGRE